MRRQTILVTGSSGQLGSALVQRLSRDHNLVLLDVKEPGSGTARCGRVVVGSFTEPATVAEAMEGVDTVIHAGGIPGNATPHERLIQVNVMGTFTLLEEAGARAEVEHFIYVSSICWHGIHSGQPGGHAPQFLPVTEDHPALWGDYYSSSKVQAEYWCRKYVHHFGKPVVAVRPSYIVPLHREASVETRPPRDIPCLYDYVGTSDLIEGILRAMDYAPAEGFDRFLFNAADQWSACPTLELVDMQFPGIPVDRDKLAREGGYAALVDCSHAREALGWEPALRCRRGNGSPCA